MYIFVCYSERYSCIEDNGKGEGRDSDTFFIYLANMQQWIQRTYIVNTVVLEKQYILQILCVYW